jgi:hypothetical protein
MIPRPTAGLGGVMEERDPSVVGLRPGQVYAGGPQTQQQGLRGQVSENLMKRWDHLFRGKNPAVCGPINTHECADIISRLLEQTFRNFQLTARPPSHLAPPFSSTPIDTRRVTVINIGPLAPVVQFQMPKGNYRGVISSFGQALENAAAFADVEWAILINGQPAQQFISITQQLMTISNILPLPSPILLRGGDLVVLAARAIAAPPHTATGRLVGWFYPVRVEMDNSIGSTLVD